MTERDFATGNVSVRPSVNVNVNVTAFMYHAGLITQL